VTDAQVASIRQLTERVSGISSSTRSVAVDIRDAQKTAHETEQMSADMVQTAALIGEQANHLRDQVGRFVLDLRSAGSSAPPPAPQHSQDFQDAEPIRALAS
jgi:hypothetical protein